MEYLPPLFFRQKYYAAIEAEIVRLCYDLIYAPLQELLRASGIEIQNSISALIDAIRHGDIWYHAGEFRGSYNAAITKELRLLGAEYNKLTKTWKLEPGLLPSHVSMAVAYARNHNDAIRRNVTMALDNIDVFKISQNVDTSALYAQTLNMMETAFQGSLVGVDAITITPKLTDMQRDIIAKEWGNNLNLYIKDWADETILDLRQKVQPYVLGGGRAENLVKTLQDSYGSTKAKARFLAHQETSLLMSKFRETRYADIGVRTYKWSGAMDARERPDHRALQGKIFNFGQPPITNKRTGARNNPGEDFGCRCVAIAVFD